MSYYQLKNSFDKGVRLEAVLNKEQKNQTDHLDVFSHQAPRPNKLTNSLNYIYF